MPIGWLWKERTHTLFWKADWMAWQNSGNSLTGSGPRSLPYPSCQFHLPNRNLSQCLEHQCETFGLMYLFNIFSYIILVPSSASNVRSVYLGGSLLDTLALLYFQQPFYPRKMNTKSPILGHQHTNPIFITKLSCGCLVASRFSVAGRNLKANSCQSVWVDFDFFSKILLLCPGN